MMYGYLVQEVQEGPNPHFGRKRVSVSFLNTYGNIILWPVVQDRSDMSFVSNGYK